MAFEPLVRRWEAMPVAPTLPRRVRNTSVDRRPLATFQVFLPTR